MGEVEVGAREQCWMKKQQVDGMKDGVGVGGRMVMEVKRMMGLEVTGGCVCMSISMMGVFVRVCMKGCLRKIGLVRVEETSPQCHGNRNVCVCQLIDLHTHSGDRGRKMMGCVWQGPNHSATHTH